MRLHSRRCHFGRACRRCTKTLTAHLQRTSSCGSPICGLQLAPPPVQVVATTLHASCDDERPLAPPGERDETCRHQRSQPLKRFISVHRHSPASRDHNPSPVIETALLSGHQQYIVCAAQPAGIFYLSVA